MGMPAAQDRYYTRAEVLDFPEDGNRYELVHGELLVSPSPRSRHQRLVGDLYFAIRLYLQRFPVGEVMTSPADISWGEDDDTTVQPDIFVIAPPDVGPKEWIELSHFHLFVEILSPSTARFDRFTKRRLYQERKVPAYWIVDDEHRRVEIWTPQATAPQYESERLTWLPPGATEACVIELDALWRE